MRAIILAAGRGKRMGNLTENYPKCMLPLHDKPLIEWQIQAMQKAGITEIAIIKGYKGNTLTYPVNYFNNPRWEETNMLSTLCCAEEWLYNYTCLVSYSDIVYDSEVVKKLIHSHEDITISFDPNWLQLWKQRFQDPLCDAEIFKYENNKLIDIGGKAEELHEIQGQYMGLLKFTANGWREIKRFLHKLSTENIKKLDMTSLLKLMLKNDCEISVVAIDTPWCEIDNITDYQLCQKIFVSKMPTI